MSRGRTNLMQAKKIKTEKDPFIKSKIQDRLAMLTGSVGVIYVGANSKVELKEKKDRVEDAIYATKAALQEGIVPGGGSTLVHVSDELLEWCKENLIGDELIGGAYLYLNFFCIILAKFEFDFFTPTPLGGGY